MVASTAGGMATPASRRTTSAQGPEAMAVSTAACCATVAACTSSNRWLAWSQLLPLNSSMALQPDTSTASTTPVVMCHANKPVQVPITGGTPAQHEHTTSQSQASKNSPLKL